MNLRIVRHLVAFPVFLLSTVLVISPAQAQSGGLGGGGFGGGGIGGGPQVDETCLDIAGGGVGDSPETGNSCEVVQTDTGEVCCSCENGALNDQHDCPGVSGPVSGSPGWPLPPLCSLGFTDPTSDSTCSVDPTAPVGCNIKAVEKIHSSETTIDLVTMSSSGGGSASGGGCAGCGGGSSVGSFHYDCWIAVVVAELLRKYLAVPWLASKIVCGWLVEMVYQDRQGTVSTSVIQTINGFQVVRNWRSLQAASFCRQPIPVRM